MKFNWRTYHHDIAKELYLHALKSPDFKIENLDATTSLCIKLANKFVDELKKNEKMFGY